MPASLQVSKQDQHRSGPSFALKLRGHEEVSALLYAALCADKGRAENKEQLEKFRAGFEARCNVVGTQDNSSVSALVAWHLKYGLALPPRASQGTFMNAQGLGMGDKAVAGLLLLHAPSFAHSSHAHISQPCWRCCNPGKPVCRRFFWARTSSGPKARG